MKLYTIYVAMIFLSSQIFAVTAVTGQIKSLSNGWGGEGYYFFLENPNIPNGCSDSSRFYISATRPDYNIMIANVMLAYSLRSNVRIDVDGPCYSGTVGNTIGVGLN